MAVIGSVDILLNLRSAGFTTGVVKANRQLGMLGKTTGRILRTMSAFAALFIARGMIRGMIGTVKAAGDLQFQMIQVSRITGIAGEQLESFRTSLLKLSTEVVASVSELSELAVVVARAGVHSERGMIQIARAASMMAELASDLSPVQATNALLKIIKAMGLTTAAALNVGSAVVGIAKAVAATEGEIISAVQRMAGVGRVLGMTVDQLTALAGVTIQMGVRATRAGTLWTRAFLQLDKNSRKAAAAIGISDAAFRKLLGTDSFNALTLLLIKIDALSDKTEKLRKLREIFQGRGVKVAGPASQELDFLMEKVALAGDLFKKGTELAKDYTMVMGSFNVVMKLLGQSFQIIGIAFGGTLLPALTQFAQNLRTYVLSKEGDIKAFGESAAKNISRFNNALRDPEFRGAIKKAADAFIEFMKVSVASIGATIVAISLIPVAIQDSIKGLKLLGNRLIEFFAGAMQGYLSIMTRMPGVFGESARLMHREMTKFISELEAEFEGLTDEKALTQQLVEGFNKAKEAAEEFGTTLGKIMSDEEEGDKIPGLPSGDEIAEQLNFFQEMIAGIKKDLENLKSFNQIVGEGITGVWTNTWSSIQSGFSTAMQKMILEGGKLSTRLKAFWEGIKIAFVKAIADMIAELAVWALKQIFFQKFVSAASIAMAAALYAAWAPVAAVVSLAMAGANAGPAIAGIAATKAAALVPLQEGGIVPGIGRGDRVPALLEPGELVVPRKDVASVINNTFNPQVSVSMAGAIVMDDPIAVQRLYREYLRDTIRDDIEGGRDNFY